MILDMVHAGASEDAIANSLERQFDPTSKDDLTYVAEGDLGKGLFAKTPIARGFLILRFVGPTISFEDAVQKGDKECYPLQIDYGKYIDLEAPGCFANHSCDPNAGISRDMELVALKDIAKDEEIRYDYSTTMDEDHFTMPCRCGADKCRRTVTDFKCLPAEVKLRYLAMRKVMAFIEKQYPHSS